MLDNMAVELAKRFQQLQEERTQAFHQLDQHHKIFLCHAPEYENGFDEFKKSVSQVTDKFREISCEIIRIKEELSNDPSKLSSLIERVQELEEKKLNTVVDLQLARQQSLDNPGDELCEKNADLIKAGLVKLEEQITETLTDVRYEIVEIA
eukprot:GFUD01012796.1.p1 GENE.GFUD01012796.1~~GFUD01012796.1.p1  ORF type:complete len:151 (-),score=56.64 GFUD01012796.1:49-501(-)